MYPRVMALFFSICFSLPASAQSTAFVQGQVVDEAQRPMAFVNVQIVDTTDGATTGRDGRFAFSTRRLGRHDLSATFIGFEPARRTLHLTAGDRIGVRVAEPSFDGRYRGRSDNNLHNLLWTDVWADWSIRTSASLNRHAARRQLGNLDLTPRDLTGKIRTDWERLLGGFGILRLGTEVEHADNRFVGSIPQGDILDPEAEVFELDASYSARRTGAPTATSCWMTPI